MELELSPLMQTAIPLILAVLVAITLIRSFTDALFQTIFSFAIVRIALFALMVYLIVKAVGVPVPVLDYKDIFGM